jgi:hypothetical protein
MTVGNARLAEPLNNRGLGQVCVSDNSRHLPVWRYRVPAAEAVGCRNCSLRTAIPSAKQDNSEQQLVYFLPKGLEPIHPINLLGSTLHRRCLPTNECGRHGRIDWNDLHRPKLELATNKSLCYWPPTRPRATACLTTPQWA